MATPARAALIAALLAATAAAGCAAPGSGAPTSQTTSSTPAASSGGINSSGSATATIPATTSRITPTGRPTTTTPSTPATSRTPASSPFRPTSATPSSSESGSSTSSTAQPVITVAGITVPATGIPDVATALRIAGVSPPDGRLLAVSSGRVLDAHVDPAGIRVNSAPASLATPLRPYDVVTFVAGHDRVEGTQEVTEPVYLDAAAAALYVGYRPGASRVIEGARSGEVVSSTVTRAPTVGRLRSPARFALTIDDGPSPSATPQVLDLLDRYGVKAVFCLIGDNALGYPDLARREAAAGHELCDHTQNHPLNLPQLSASRIRSEVTLGFASIVTADGGVRPRYFRAPGGNWSTTIIDDARALGLAPLRWTVDPRDWSVPGTQQIITTVLDQLRPDGIVLVHDGGGDRSETVQALGILLDELVAAGWTVTLPTWVR
jgi:peptidoglycan/xylan/chitin deacetylase (PgdA/CDA1 family)